MSPPCSGWKNKPAINQNEEVRKAQLAVCFMIISCLAYSSTLKKEATYSF
jgi:hypothetical protein